MAKRNLQDDEMKMKESNTIQEIKKAYALSLLCKTPVVGVGIGYKYTGGVSTETLSITILVLEKIRDSLLSDYDKIPRELDGIPTDVISMNKTIFHSAPRKSPMPENERCRRWRPAPAGVSVGHYQLNGAGTLGAWVRDSESEEPLLLSNWHVIANMGDCKKGDPILQPAAIDGGRNPEDVIAHLERWVDVQMIVDSHKLTDARQRLRELLANKSEIPLNKVDAALARPISDKVVSDKILGIGKLNKTCAGPFDMFSGIEIGDRVTKSGRTTGVTEGRISLKNVDIFVIYPKGIALFTDQVGI
jgi:hypothetical protein